MSPCQHALLLAKGSLEPDELKDGTEKTWVNIQCLLTLLNLLWKLHGLFFVAQKVEIVASVVLPRLIQSAQVF
jgi:hypothetical protein